MDPEAAHSALSMVVQATATLVGLLVIGVVFYFEKSESLRSGIRWMKECELVMGPTYSSYVLTELMLVIVSVFMPLVFGLSLMYDTMSHVGSIPGDGGNLTPEQIDFVESILGRFGQFLFSFGFGVSVLLLLGYSLPEIEPELAKSKERIREIDERSRRALQDELAQYRERKLKPLSREEAAQELELEIRKGKTSDLNSRLLVTLERELGKEPPSRELPGVSMRTQTIHLLDELASYLDDIIGRSERVVYRKVISFIKRGIDRISIRMENRAQKSIQRKFDRLRTEREMSLMKWKRFTLRRMLWEEYR